jgi:hypothetical protein
MLYFHCSWIPLPIKPAVGRLFSLFLDTYPVFGGIKKSAKNKVSQRSQRLCGEFNILVAMASFFIFSSNT